MADLLEIGNFLIMLYSFGFFVFAAVRLRILSRPLLYLVIPFTLFALAHGMYHLFLYLGVLGLARFLNFTSVVILLVAAVQLIRERL